MRTDRWYAVHTKPWCEDKAVFFLQRRTALPVFVPRLESTRRIRGRKVQRIEPMFPSYLFVHMSMEPTVWDAVRWTPGVKEIVGTNGVPVPVPDQAIDILMSRASLGPVRWMPEWQSGTTVRVTHGPFAGLVGILERPTSRAERVRVLLNLMRTTAPVELDIIDLEETSSNALTGP